MSHFKSAHEVSVQFTQMFIDGEFRDSCTGQTFKTVHPASGHKIADISRASVEDVQSAVESASRAFEGPWKELSGRERARYMFHLADLIERDSEHLALLETLDTGKPIVQAQGYDIPSAAAVLRYFAGWADKLQGKTIPLPRPLQSYTRREPVGVCALITPWNFPLALACWKLGPMLAAGCTGVLKPAEQTPLTALHLASLMAEANFPPGVVNILPGYGHDAGAALVKHPKIDKISFTGSGETARAIKETTASSMKRLTFELGGKSPNLVFADADLEAAVEGALGAAFLNQGQNCCAGTRLYLQESIQEEFLSLFIPRVQALRLGDPFDVQTEHGPVIDQAQFDRVMGHIQTARSDGSQCITGGEPSTEGPLYIQPTVFHDVKHEQSLAREEVFGPVLCAFSFCDKEEALRLANHTHYGLAAGVWTQNLSTAQYMLEGIRAGTVWINCYNAVDTAAPFGGVRASGLGRDLGEQALDGYTETKTVTMAF